MDVPDPLPPESANTWDRQLGETADQHVLFVRWLEHAPSVDRAFADSVGLPLDTLRVLAVQKRWSERRSAYSAALQFLERETAARFVANQTGRLQGLFQSVFELCSRSVADHLAQGRVVHTRELAQLLRTLTDGLRLLKGESTHNHAFGRELAGTPDEILAQMREGVLALTEGPGSSERADEHGN